MSIFAPAFAEHNPNLQIEVDYLLEYKHADCEINLNLTKSSPEFSIIVHPSQESNF